MKKRVPIQPKTHMPLFERISPTLIHSIFFIVLIFGIGFRLSFLSTLYRVDDGDTARDYMVARHIAVFHQYPTIGPNNAIYDAVRASPLYYYLLAIPVLIYDSVYSIGVLNIALQAMSTTILYALAFMLFGQTTAILTAILLLFNQDLFSQSFYMIQAHFGHVFFNGSYLFLANSYLYKSRRSLYISAVLFALGCVISFHGFPALLGYLLVTFFVARAQKTSLPQIFPIYAVMLAIALFFYTPMLVNMVRSGNTFFLIQEPVYIDSFANFPLKIINNLLLVVDDWMRALWLSISAKNILLGSLGIVLMYHMIIYRHTKALYARIISLFILQIVTLAAYLRIPTNSYQYDAATGLSIVLLAYTASTAWPKNKVGHVGSLVSTILLIFLVIPTRGYIQWQHSQQNQPQKLESKLAPLFVHLDNQKSTNPSNWNSQFQIAMYNGRSPMYHWKESVIWNALERRYAIPFVRVVNYGYNYAPLAKGEQYYILICEEYASLQDAADRCISSFIQTQKEDSYLIETISDNSPTEYVIFGATYKHTQ